MTARLSQSLTWISLPLVACLILTSAWWYILDIALESDESVVIVVADLLSVFAVSNPLPPLRVTVCLSAERAASLWTSLTLLDKVGRDAQLVFSFSVWAEGGGTWVTKPNSLLQWLLLEFSHCLHVLHSLEWFISRKGGERLYSITNDETANDLYVFVFKYIWVPVWLFVAVVEMWDVL